MRFVSKSISKLWTQIIIFYFSVSTFLHRLCSWYLNVSITFLMLMDINIHLDKPDNVNTTKFNHLLSSHAHDFMNNEIMISWTMNINSHKHQKCDESTNIGNNTLDIGITRSTISFVSYLHVAPPELSDHSLIHFNTHHTPPPVIFLGRLSSVVLTESLILYNFKPTYSIRTSINLLTFRSTAICLLISSFLCMIPQWNPFLITMHRVGS